MRSGSSSRTFFLEAKSCLRWFFLFRRFRLLLCFLDGVGSVTPGALTPTDSGVCVSKVDCILDVASLSDKSFPTTLMCNADDATRPDVKEMGENASVVLVVTAYKHSVKALASCTIFGD